MPRAVGLPTAFVSHAFDNPFELLVSALREHFADGVESEVFVWLDVFAICQHAPGRDLHAGRALLRTINLAADTVMVLNMQALPLSRLWCLYELACTPPAKLRLLGPPGFGGDDLEGAVKALRVEAAGCSVESDRVTIHELILQRYESFDAFETTLRLRLLLKPTSYEADCEELLQHSDDEWRLGMLRDFLLLNEHSAGYGVDPGAPRHRVALVVDRAGEGKSTLAAALRTARRSDTATDSQLLVDACHFFKASDPRRQKERAVRKSLTYQLALRHAEMAQTVLGMRPYQIWWDICWSSFRSFHDCRSLAGKRLVIVLDGADEARDIRAQGGGDCFRLLSRLLSNTFLAGIDPVHCKPLPTTQCAISLVVTTRPEERVMSALRDALAMLREKGCNIDAVEFALNDLRASTAGSPRGAGGTERRQPAVTSGLLRRLASALPDVDVSGDAYAAYAAIFSAPLDAAARRALAVVVTARQPPTVAVLHAMGALEGCRRLPGWGALFVEREHRVQPLHKSLTDWLSLPEQAGRLVDFELGHAAWAERRMPPLRAWLWPAPGAPPAEAPRWRENVYADVLPHLQGARDGATARALLLRLPWLQQRLHFRSYGDLRDDVEKYFPTDGEGGDVIRAALLRALSVSEKGTPGRDSLATLLAGSLCGVLTRTPAADVAALYAEVHAWRSDVAWLRPLHATLPCDDDADDVPRHTPGPVSDGDQPSAIYALEELDDGRVASAGRDGAIRLWQPANGACERVLLGHTGAVTCLAAPAAGTLVSGSLDRTVRVWATGEGESARVLSWPDCGEVTALAALASGARVAAFYSSGAALVWCLHTGECMRELRALTPMPARQATCLRGGRIAILTRCGLYYWDAAPDGAPAGGGEARCIFEMGVGHYPGCMHALADGGLLFRVGVCYVFPDMTRSPDVEQLFYTFTHDGRQADDYQYVSHVIDQNSATSKTPPPVHRRWGPAIERYNFPAANLGETNPMKVAVWGRRCLRHPGRVAYGTDLPADIEEAMLQVTLPPHAAAVTPSNEEEQRVVVVVALRDGRVHFYEVVPPAAAPPPGAEASVRAGEAQPSGGEAAVAGTADPYACTHPCCRR